MKPEELDRRLDEWLDQVTADYGKAEIRPGFEARIIAKVNSRLAKRRWHFRLVYLASAMAAILFMSVYLFRKPIQHRVVEKDPVDVLSNAASVYPNLRVPENDPERWPLPDSGSSVRPSIKTSTRNDLSARKKKTAQRGRFLSGELSDRERYLVTFVREKSKSVDQGIPEDAIFDPLVIGQVQIPKFEIQDFTIPSHEIQVAPTSINGSEDQL